MARKLATILACVPVALSAATALPAAGDLAADARLMRSSAQPLVVLYSQTGCTWCEEARRYLVPLSTADESHGRALFRQIDIDSDTALTDFAGVRTTHRAFARTRKIRLTPTVALYDADGRELGQAIVGLRLPDFYGQYIINAIDAARSTLKAR